MNKVAVNASEVVELHHHYQATAEQVFAAWSNPEALGQWFGPHSHHCKIEKFDFKEGGEYQIRMIPVENEKDPDCHGDTSKDSVCAGTFVQIQAPNKIVMGFNWIENGADIGDSLLTIEIQDREGGADVVLIHEKIPTEELRKAHQGGWQGTLECLEEFLTA